MSGIPGVKLLINLPLNTPGSIAFAIGANGFLVESDWWPVLEGSGIPVMYAYVRERNKEVADKMQLRIPNARIEAFPGVGHCLMVDEPDRFNRILAEFLESVEER